MDIVEDQNEATRLLAEAEREIAAIRQVMEPARIAAGGADPPRLTPPVPSTPGPQLNTLTPEDKDPLSWRLAAALADDGT